MTSRTSSPAADSPRRNASEANVNQSPHLSGRVGKPTGCSQAEPEEVSALRASPPRAAFTPGPRDLEVLADLIAAYDMRKKWAGESNDGVAPLDCGGRDGSDHSYRLSKLAEKGLAEQRYRGLGWGERPKRSLWRGSKLYRPTEEGRAALAKARGDA